MARLASGMETVATWFLGRCGISLGFEIMRLRRARTSMMQYAVGTVLALATLALAVGAITGKVKATSCCAPADPAHDRRMQIVTENTQAK